MKWWFSIGIVLMVVLAGCGYSPDSPALTGTPSQRGTEDSLEEYYERMERWRVLHGGMSKWESDK